MKAQGKAARGEGRLQIGEWMRRPAWHGGQLMAFSGLDGATDFARDLVLRSAFGEPGLDIKLPGLGRIRFPSSPGPENEVAGDWFRIGSTVRGVFLDAYHLLIEGPCEVLELSPNCPPPPGSTARWLASPLNSTAACSLPICRPRWRTGPGGFRDCRSRLACRPSGLALECETLAGFARDLGRPDEAARWAARHARLCQLIGTRLWSDELGFFVDYDHDRKCPSPVLASSGFLPLICGAASPAQAERLAAWVQDPAWFGTVVPVPSISASDREHYAKDMWRGPVWVNVNWLIAFGFERYGLHALADRLREKTRAEIERTTEKFGVLFEYFDDRGEAEPPELIRKGSCPAGGDPSRHQPFHDYGWTATLYVDLVHSAAHNCGADATGRRRNRGEGGESRPAFVCG